MMYKLGLMLFWLTIITFCLSGCHFASKNSNGIVTRVVDTTFNWSMDSLYTYHKIPTLSTIYLNHDSFNFCDSILIHRASQGYSNCTGDYITFCKMEPCDQLKVYYEQFIGLSKFQFSCKDLLNYYFSEVTGINPGGMKMGYPGPYYSSNEDIIADVRAWAKVLDCDEFE